MSKAIAIARTVILGLVVGTAFGIAFGVIGTRFAAAEEHGAHGGGKPAVPKELAVTHHDMYRYFNIWDDFSLSPKTDILGGPTGDSMNRSPDGKILVEAHDGHLSIAPEEKRPPAFLYMLINFLVFAWIVARFARPAASKLAAERHDQIKTALEEAAKLRKDAADKLDEYETKLKAADDEIKKLVEGMKADAEADKKRILAAAETQAAQMKREAEQRIAAEILYARSQLTRDVTNAATAAAERILRDKLKPADQQALVGTFVASLEAQKEAGHGQR